MEGVIISLGILIFLSHLFSVMFVKTRIPEVLPLLRGLPFKIMMFLLIFSPFILYCLMEYEPVRFNEMQRYLGKIADKILSQNLKELEADELIIRTVYPQIPPKVEYTLTDRGHSLVKVLDTLCDWGLENRP